MVGLHSNFIVHLSVLTLLVIIQKKSVLMVSGLDPTGQWELFELSVKPSRSVSASYNHLSSYITMAISIIITKFTFIIIIVVIFTSSPFILWWERIFTLIIDDGNMIMRVITNIVTSTTLSFLSHHQHCNHPWYHQSDQFGWAY